MQILEYVTKVLANGIFFVALYTAGEYAFYRAMPMSGWVDYKYVTPVKTEFKVGEDLKFISFAEINHSPTIEWNDILYCIDSETNKLERYSSFTSKTEAAKNRTVASDAPTWKYGGEVPKSPASCCLDTQVKLFLPYDIEKVQTLKGELFKIK